MITLRIEGYPPAKSEALSILGPNHPHSERVICLLEAARSMLQADPEVHLGDAPLKMDVVVALPAGLRSDATNYLGGIADVLQNKQVRGELLHLGALAEIHLFDDDRQIEQIQFRFEQAEEPAYVVHLDYAPGS